MAGFSCFGGRSLLADATVMPQRVCQLRLVGLASSAHRRSPRIPARPCLSSTEAWRSPCRDGTQRPPLPLVSINSVPRVRLGARRRRRSAKPLHLNKIPHGATAPAACPSIKEKALPPGQGFHLVNSRTCEVPFSCRLCIEWHIPTEPWPRHCVAFFLIIRLQIEDFGSN